MRTKTVGIAIILSMAFATVTVRGHHHFKQDFYIYDVATTDFVVGAVVTVSYTGGSQQAESRRPHGNASFIVPGELATLDVSVTASGYAPDERTVVLNGRPNVGGKGFWIGLTPLAARDKE
jgi:hypothetical protein